MKASVLVPAHNYARFVGEAVDSVLAQDYDGPVECIVVDDGSTDGTPEVLEAYRGRVTCIRQENRGMAAALNTAYAASSGDIVCLLDADDVWRPGKLSTVTEVLRSRPDVGLVYHEVETVADRGRSVPDQVVASRTADGDVRRLVRLKCLPWMFRPTSTLCLSRQVAGHVFPLATVLRGNADDLVAPAAALLAPVRFVPEPLSRYRIHGENLWAGRQGTVGHGDSRTPGPAADPFEDVDGWEEPRRYCRLLEVKTAYVNSVMERAGEPAGFSPWLSWTYVKHRSRMEGVPPRRYVREILRAAAMLGGVSVPDRLAVAVRLLRRALKHREPETMAAPAGVGGGDRVRRSR